MDAGIEKECSALGGLFQLIMNDMKASYPTWEDFVTKGAKLQSQLRTTIVVTGAFLDAFQKVADMATGTRGATKEIGSALTRMCMRHRSIESKLKLFTTALSEGLISPLELKMEEWKKVASQLDKDHAKEYKRARADIKKKSSDTIKLQKKVKKGKDEARGQLDSALQDVNVRYGVLEETEKRNVCRALLEERARYCSFVSMLKPVLDHEINMLGEVTHLQTILEDLTNLTAEPNKLPQASEQVILDLKGSDFNYSYQTPPASPSNTLSRKSSISSNYQSGSVRHVPSLDSISCAVDGVHIQDAVGSTNQLAAGGRRGGAENGLLAPPHNAYSHHRREGQGHFLTCTHKCSSLLIGGLYSEIRLDYLSSQLVSSFLCISLLMVTLSGLLWVCCSLSSFVFSWLNFLPSLPAVRREPPLYVDYESISLHGDADSISLHHLHHGSSQSDFDKSSTIPRNSDLSFQFRKFAQSKRPASTVSLLAEPELLGRSARQLPSHTATIRRKPSSKPAYRRGTISGGVPIPISTPQVPLKALAGNGGGSEENVFAAPSGGGAGGLAYSKLCTSTQSLSALPPSSSSSSSPYYQLVPGQMPIPVPGPTVPSLPQEGSNSKQQHLQQQQHINQHVNHHQQRSQLQQHNQQLHIQQQQQQQQQYLHQQQQLQQQLQHQKQLQQQQHLQQQQQLQQLQQQLQHDQYQEQLNQQQKQKLFQQHHQVQMQVQSQGEASGLGHQQPQAPPPSSHTQNQNQEPLVPEGGGMLNQIRAVKLKRTQTNDRSAPLLPPPTNH
ncbi:LOW QUALITY PROTEIN: protein MTSS 1 [Centropristis striata]|uniref:LOW QUALITY PROTEIN: protein MTSS 1 n=1 Tax=Centropristis striata TaxID=184440 RepID=UPI0027E08965|nr:LOW QUALITY PROTEIN: protein MTSS 1 [Centropristis striata]